jgi:hypothetical protein
MKHIKIYIKKVEHKDPSYDFWTWEFKVRRFFIYCTEAWGSNVDVNDAATAAMNTANAWLKK